MRRFFYHTRDFTKVIELTSAQIGTIRDNWAEASIRGQSTWIRIYPTYEQCLEHCQAVLLGAMETHATLYHRKRAQLAKLMANRDARAAASP